MFKSACIADIQTSNSGYSNSQSSAAQIGGR
jgi:hypothetical protein